MERVTLLSVNWNQLDALKLMLSSYALHHYEGVPLRIMLVDNGSTDGSKEWLREQEIPFIDLPQNLGHEQAINYVYGNIATRFCLLADTDIEFRNSVSDYVQTMREKRILSCGELIVGDQLNAPVKPRISAWFWLFDIAYMKDHEVKKFRDTDNWEYDVGSWYWEKMQELRNDNQENYFFNLHLNTTRISGHLDRDIEGMVYDRFVHYGKVSWDLEKHGDRHDEVMRRRAYIKERLEVYKNIDLRGKFTS